MSSLLPLSSPRPYSLLTILLLLTLPQSLLSTPVPPANTTTITPSSLSIYASTYGTIFIWHAALATLTWALIAPLGHIISRLTRLRGSSERAFVHHRALMLLTLLLTAVVFALGLIFANPGVPKTHRALGFAIFFLTALQAVLGTVRPSKDDRWRSLWRRMHRAVGVSVLVVGGYVVHHSFDVFDVSSTIKLAVDVSLALMVVAFVIVQLAGCWLGDASEEESREASQQLLSVQPHHKQYVGEEHTTLVGNR